MVQCPGNTNNYSLATTDSKFWKSQWHTHPGGLQGEEVRQFIIRISQVMIQLGMLATTLGEEADLYCVIFCNDLFNRMVE